MGRVILFMLVCALHTTLVAGEEHPSIVPPKGWNSITDAEQLPQKVCLLYVGTGKSQFSPSINISSEETTLTREEYLALAKSYHEGQGETQVKSLGQLKTPSGAADLIQIDRATQMGQVRFVQGVIVHEQMAYVITATCLQDEFATLSPLFFKSMQTFSIPERNVLSPNE